MYMVFLSAFLALASSACDFRDVNQIKQLLTQAYSRGIQGPLPQEAQIQLGRMLRWSGDLQNSQKNLEELIHRNLLNGKGAPDHLLFSRYRINVPFRKLVVFKSSSEFTLRINFVFTIPAAHKGLLVLGKVYDASGCILQCLEAIKQARILHNEFCGKNNPEVRLCKICMGLLYLICCIIHNMIPSKTSRTITSTSFPLIGRCKVQATHTFSLLRAYVSFH